MKPIIDLIKRHALLLRHIVGDAIDDLKLDPDQQKDLEEFIKCLEEIAEERFKNV